MLSPLQAAKTLASYLNQRLLVTAPGEVVLRAWNRTPTQEYLRTAASRKLHLGCGPRLFPGWLNADLPSMRRLLTFDRSRIAINASRPLPFENGTFDRVYSEHMHEHLAYQDGLSLLKEVRRVLRPGGRVRLALPDLEFHISMIQSAEAFQEYPEMFASSIEDTDGLAGAPLTKTTFLNLLFRGSGHKYLYSRPELRSQLERAGFTAVTFVQPGQSEDPQFRDLENNPMSRDQKSIELHVGYTVSVEADSL
jgi:SAM-dependent methyltransferase